MARSCRAKRWIDDDEMNKAQLKKFQDLLGNLPEVQECYSVTGDFDYSVELAALMESSGAITNARSMTPGWGMRRSGESSCTSS